MKSSFLVLLISFCTTTVFSQFKMIAQSDPFDEPQEGYCKLIQLTNGNTIFILTTKKGINVKLYDKAYRLKSDNLIDQPENKIQSVESVFEMRGDLAFFYLAKEDDNDMLYRMTIDGKKGTLKHSDKVSSMTKLSRRQTFGEGLDHTPFQHYFNIRKDQNDQYYAIATCNSYAEGNGKQVEVVFYGMDNKEIARAYCAAPDKYRFVKYVDMVVIGGQKVVLMGYAGNTTKRKNRDGELVVATLDSGAHTVLIDDLELTKEIMVEGGIARYNPVTRSVVLLAAVKQPKDEGYTPIMAFVNPFERQITNIFPVFPERANGKSEELFGKKNGFNGMPQNMFVDNQGDISVVFEEMINYTGSSNYTELGDLAVARFDPNGKETGGYLIPKKIVILGLSLRTFYHSIEEGTATWLNYGNQFKYFSYLNGLNGKDYILFNDIEENAENTAEGKKPKKITGVGACDAFSFSLNGNNPLPGRQFVFGKPDSHREHQLALFSISDYDRDNNKYATLLLDHEGRSKQVRIVWMQPF